MDKVLSTLRTLGVLVGIWAVLAIVGLALGAIPPATVPESAPDAGPRAHDAGTHARDAGVVAVDAAAPEAPPIALHRYGVCAGEPSIAVGSLFGDPKPELVIGCSDGWHVLALSAQGPSRIAVLSVQAAPPDQHNTPGPAAFGDVDGDGHGDVVLPLARASAEGATRGGGLWWVAGDSLGGLRDPALLGPIAAAAVAIAPFDPQAGAEVVAMNRTNALAQLPSEAWVFRGGSAPARAATLQTGLAGADVRIGDLDRDGRPDVAALARDRVDLFFGDEELSFTRRHSLQMAGASEIAIADMDGDGGEDLVVLGGGLRWIHGGEVSGMEPHVIDGAPDALRSISIADIDGDGRRDILGWDHPRLIALAQREPGHFTRVEMTAVVGAFGPRRHLLFDADADGASDDLAMVGGASADEVALVLVPNALTAQRVSADETSPVADAPLVLRAALPQP